MGGCNIFEAVCPAFVDRDDVVDDEGVGVVSACFKIYGLTANVADGFGFLELLPPSLGERCVAESLTRWHGTLLRVVVRVRVVRLLR